ncbi:hypothetical protein [Bacillus smithii]|uniref:hypothetical protein n=1 Tax=Bacillus smithii TaxID=1479 RepID=UPI003D20EB9E
MDIEKWAETVDRMFKRQREIDQKLSPSKSEIKYIKSYTHSLMEKVDYIEFTSVLAHEGKIDFDMAQKIMNWQKQQIKKDVEYFKLYLGLDENEEK